MIIRAIYKNGSFEPLESIELKEGTVVEILMPALKVPKTKKPIRESGIFGIWRNRTDITDGVDYVNQLRGRNPFRRN